MDSTIAALALKVRAADHDSTLGSRAERFMVRTLARCDELLESRAPGRVLVVRNFEVSLRLPVEAMQDAIEVDACAEAVADGLDERARSGRDDDVAVFVDDVEWRAGHLHDWATGANRSSWRFDRLATQGEPLALLKDAGRVLLLRRVLASLQRSGSLPEVLAHLPFDTLARLAETLGAIPPPGNASPATAPSAVIQSDDPSARGFLQATVLALIARDGGAESARANRLVGAAADDGAFEQSSRSAVRGSEDGERGPTVEGLRSRCGGVFYLLSAALELSAGGILWQACVPEGIVFERALAAVCGAPGTDDPAAALFGGVPGGEPLPAVVPAQQLEIATALFAAFIQAIPRRHLAEWPEPVLQIVDAGHGRLLTAADANTGFVLFALPANTRVEIEDALGAFLGVWPASAPAPRARGALADLDRRGRTRSLPKSRAVPDLVLAVQDELSSTAYVSQVAGTIGQLFTARLALKEPARLIAERLAVPARIFVNPEIVTIQFAADSIDLDVRRSGFDADPGWVPWLRRRVQFVFDLP